MGTLDNFLAKKQSQRLQEDEVDKPSFYQKYVEPVGERLYGVADVAGGYTRTAALQGLSKAREATGREALYTPEEFKESYKRVGSSIIKGGPGGVTFGETFSKLDLPKWTQAPALVADIALDPAAWASMGTAPIVKGLTKGVQVATKTKKAADIAKAIKKLETTKKALKGASAIDAAAVASLGIQAAGDVSSGDYTSGALKAGLGALGVAGVKQDVGILKRADEYIPHLKEVEAKRIADAIPVGDRLSPKDFGTKPAEDVVQMNLEKLRRGETLEPVIISGDGKIVDGNHRFEALKRWGAEDIDVLKKDPSIYQTKKGKVVKQGEFIPFEDFAGKAKDIEGLSKTGKLQRYASDRGIMLEELQTQLIPQKRGMDEAANVVDKQRLAPDAVRVKQEAASSLTEDNINYLQAKRIGKNPSIYEDVKRLVTDLADDELRRKEFNEIPELTDRDLGIIDNAALKLQKTQLELRDKYGADFDELMGETQKVFDDAQVTLDRDYLDNVLDWDSYKRLKGLDPELPNTFYNKIKEANANNTPYRFIQDDLQRPYYISQQREQDLTSVTDKRQYYDNLNAADDRRFKAKTVSEREAYDPFTQNLNQERISINNRSKAEVRGAVATMLRAEGRDALTGDFMKKINYDTYKKLDPVQQFHVIDNAKGTTDYYHILNEDLGRSLSGADPRDFRKVSNFLEGVPILGDISETVQRAAFKGADVTAEFANYIAPTTHAMGRIYTKWSPSFLVKNPIKDTVSSYINRIADFKGAEKVKPSEGKIGQVLGTLTEAFDGKGPLAAKVRKLKEGGMFTHYYGKNDIKELSKVVAEYAKNPSAFKKGTQNIGKLTEAIADMSENFTRLKSYDDAMSRGFSHIQSMAIAKEAGINFSKRGEGVMINALNGIFAFTNPAVQDVFRVGKTMKSPEAVAAMSFALLAPAGALLEWNESVDPNWREGYKREELNNYHVMVMPEELGGIDIKAPKPYGYNFFTTILDGIDEIEKGGDKEDVLENVFNVGISNLVPLVGDRVTGSKGAGDALIDFKTYAPTAVLPLVQWGANENYFGSNIWPDYNGDDKSAGEMWKRTQYGVMPLITEAFGNKVSPEVVKHLLRSYMPLGREVVDFVGLFEDLNKAAAEGKEFTPQQVTSKVPVFKQFLKTKKPQARLEERIYGLRDIDPEELSKETIREYKTELRKLDIPRLDKVSMEKSLDASLKEYKAGLKSKRAKERFTLDEFKERLPKLTTSQAIQQRPEWNPFQK